MRVVDKAYRGRTEGSEGLEGSHQKGKNRKMHAQICDTTTSKKILTLKVRHMRLVERRRKTLQHI